MSTNTAARGIQNFGIIEGAAGIPTEQSKNFAVKLAQTYDKHMLKISERYLKRFLHKP